MKKFIFSLITLFSVSFSNINAQSTMKISFMDGSFETIEVKDIARITWSVNNTNAGEHESVDLGLPSGIKWATCNVGAKSPSNLGDYFAWGETKPKESYTWTNYKWCNGTENSINKYYSGDHKSTLELEDDAAHVNWGGTWRMPTSQEMNELVEECTWEFIRFEGAYGYKVIGPNGQSIFLPQAGYRRGYSLYLSGNADYWTSSLSESYSNSYYLEYIADECYWISSYGMRSVGLTVRAVCQ